LLGSVASGRYGIAVQCGMVVTMLGGSITRLLAPVLVELIAKDKSDELIDCIVRFTKLITVFSAIPFIVFAALSKPILLLWLGADFEDMYLLMIIVVGNQLLHQTTSLTFTYFNMKNMLKIPARMTFISGVLNIILSVFFVKYTLMGVYGVALGTFVTILFKTILFNVVYASNILKISPVLIWQSVLKGLYWQLILGAILFNLNNLLAVDSFIILLFLTALVLLVYGLSAFYMPLKSEDRKLFFKITKLDKIKWGIKIS